MDKVQPHRAARLAADAGLATMTVAAAAVAAVCYAIPDMKLFLPLKHPPCLQSSLDPRFAAFCSN